MPVPKDLAQLRFFLGATQFYSKFIPNPSDITGPLHKLTRKGATWKWGTEQEKSFKKLKEMLSAENVLAHFNPDLDIGISCDAAESRLGAVLFHRYPDGSERPIANVSKTLTSTQMKYGQIKKSFLNHICSKKVSPVPARPTIHLGY